MPFWEGKPRTPDSRLALRRWFADWLRTKRDNDQWLLAYDTFAQPDWRAQADATALGVAVGGLANAEAPALAAQPEPELMDALAWASGWHDGEERPSDDVLQSLAQGLSEERKRSWLARYRSTSGRELAIGPVRLRGKVPGRRIRSYMVGETARMAQEYLALLKEHTFKKKGAAGFPRGILARAQEEH